MSRSGIGDDTAVLAVPPGHRLLATTDLLIEDVHFRRSSAAPSDIGWKALAVNLSDIAAMGGIPRWALVALAVPADTDVEAVDAFYAGMAEAAAPHGVTVVGRRHLGLSGRLDRERDAARRSTPASRGSAPHARAGRRGGGHRAAWARSAAGLHALEIGPTAPATRARPARGWPRSRAAHLRPRARVAEGRWLGQAPGVHAMMDCSDGLATDLAHICRESGVGARVRLDRRPGRRPRRARPRARPRGRRARVGGRAAARTTSSCSPATRPRPTASSRASPRRPAPPSPSSGESRGRAGEIVFVDADGAPVTMRGGYEHFHG